ncbi:MAG: hypothetical protein ACTSPS_09615 [Promethearchaeota archaeon]
MNNKDNGDTRNNFTALKLIDELRQELQKIITLEEQPKGKLSDKKLGFYLIGNENHIIYIKSQIRKFPAYQIPLDKLEDYKKKLSFYFKIKSSNANQLINKYISLNDLRLSADRIYIHHPHLNINYFKLINSKEKAYWLGFLYADGFLEKNGSRLAIEINMKDEILINRFANAIGFNINYKYYPKGRNSVKLRFKNYGFTKHLLTHGFIAGERKSKNCELPLLNRHELYLSFLLGYFDGDGHQGTSIISSGSKNFLKQIKNKFNLSFVIKLYKNTTNRLTLGTELFNEMLDNYQKSLPRKRIYLLTKQQIGEKIRKFTGKKEKLKILVWEMSIKKISEIYNVAPSTISYWVKKWNIVVPPKGYWLQH